MILHNYAAKAHATCFILSFSFEEEFLSFTEKNRGNAFENEFNSKDKIVNQVHSVYYLRELRLEINTDNVRFATIRRAFACTDVRREHSGTVFHYTKTFNINPHSFCAILICTLTDT